MTNEEKTIVDHVIDLLNVVDRLTVKVEELEARVKAVETMVGVES